MIRGTLFIFIFFQVVFVRPIWRMKIENHECLVLQFSSLKLENETKSFLYEIKYYLKISFPNKFLENEKWQNKNNIKCTIIIIIIASGLINQWWQVFTIILKALVWIPWHFLFIFSTIWSRFLEYLLGCNRFSS